MYWECSNSGGSGVGCGSGGGSGSSCDGGVDGHGCIMRHVYGYATDFLPI